VNQSPRGRDGHVAFFRYEKSEIKATLAQADFGMMRNGATALV
jgi:hypothetical protein